MEQLPILGQSPAEAPRGLAALRLAFRPFYLLAAACGAVAMPLWLAVFTGRLVPAGGLAPVLWHGHEMIFGMVAAVIVGFLFTAGKTWTGLPSPRGGQLLFLVLLWLAARVAALAGTPSLFFFLDIGFLPLSAAFFADVLVRAHNTRNYGVAGLLMLLGLINIGFHLALRGVIGIDPVLALRAGLSGVILMVSTIGGRVIPFFTRNVTPGLHNEVPVWRERLLLAATGLALASWCCDARGAATAGLLAAVGILHAWRLWTWQPRATLGRPILWSLHLAYAWMPLGFLLLAWSALRGTASSPGLHAFAVGATGGLLIAMMTRTARGHTGRALKASKAETAAYALVAVAAVLRVMAPFLPPGLHEISLLLAGGAFAAAFCTYLAVFSPWLAASRADGKDG